MKKRTAKGRDERVRKDTGKRGGKENEENLKENERRQRRGKRE